MQGMLKDQEKMLKETRVILSQITDLLYGTDTLSNEKESVSPNITGIVEQASFNTEMSYTIKGQAEKIFETLKGGNK